MRFSIAAYEAGRLWAGGPLNAGFQAAGFLADTTLALSDGFFGKYAKLNPCLPYIKEASAIAKVGEWFTRYQRPAAEFTDHTTVRGERVEVRINRLPLSPFASVLHFERATSAEHPKLLVVPPLSGHTETLLSGTIKTLLPDHDVHLLAFHNIRHVPAKYGAFDLDDFTDHIPKALHMMGPGGHLFAICQPGPASIVAAARMTAAGDECVPRSMSFVGSPFDTSKNPQAVNKAAAAHTVEWVERNMVDIVPSFIPSPFGLIPTFFAGAGRGVIPGHDQVAGFIWPNAERHEKAIWGMVDDIAAGRHESFERTRDFYEEYLFRLQDLPKEFALQTYQRIFNDQDLARGTYRYRGEPVDPAVIRCELIQMFGGSKDDICAYEQTTALEKIAPNARRHIKQEFNTGHFGMFNGRIWEGEVYDALRRGILSAEKPRAQRPAAPLGAQL